MNLEELTALSQRTAQRLEQITGEKATFLLYIQQAQQNLTQLEGWELQCHQVQQKIEASFNRQAEIERLEQERTALAARLSQLTGEVAGVNAQLSSVQTQLAQFSVGPVSAGTGTGTAAINPVPGLTATTGAGTETSGVMQPTYPAAFTSYQPPQLQPTFTTPPPPSVNVVLQPAAPIQPLPDQVQPQPQPQPQPPIVTEVNEAGGDVEALEGSELEVNQSETRPQQELPTPELENEAPQPQPQLPVTTPVVAPEPPSPLALPAITFEPTVNAVSKNGHHAPTAPT